MARARKHRENEILRLRADPEGASRIKREDLEQIPVPTSSTTFPTYFDSQKIYDRWRQLIYLEATGNSMNASAYPHTSNGAQHEAFNGLSNSQNMASLPQHNPQPLTAPSNSAAYTPIVEPWLGPGMNAADSTNLDAFLGIDSEMEYIEGMDFNTDFDFDWNSWFESAKDIL